MSREASSCPELKSSIRTISPVHRTLRSRVDSSRADRGQRLPGRKACGASDGSTQPPGDVVNVSVLLFPGEHTITLELRAFTRGRGAAGEVVAATANDDAHRHRLWFRSRPGSRPQSARSSVPRARSGRPGKPFCVLRGLGVDGRDRVGDVRESLQHPVRPPAPLAAPDDAPSRDRGVSAV